MFRKNIISIGISLSLLTLGLANLSQNPAHSLPENKQANQQTTQDDNSFFNPPPLGSPQRTTNGGARGECPAYSDRNQRLTILIPDDDQMTVASSTISEYPTFLLYLPKYSGIKGLVLRLLDDKEEEVFTQIIPVSSQSGIIRITLPESKFKGLKSGKWYIWHLFISDSDNMEDLDQIKKNTGQCDWVEGFIGRLPLNSTQQAELDAANDNPEERWHFYAQEVIWYDALATLDQMRRENPEDQRIQRRWEAFLGLIGLGELSEYPPIEISEISQK